MTKLWVSCSFATGQVDVENDIIISAPPIWKKFIGQEIDRLFGWLAKKELIVENL